MDINFHALGLPGWSKQVFSFLGMLSREPLWACRVIYVNSLLLPVLLTLFLCWERIKHSPSVLHGSVVTLKPGFPLTSASARTLIVLLPLVILESAWC